MKPIVVVGLGGFAKEVAFLIEDINKAKPEWEVLGFIDKDVGSSNGKHIVYAEDEWLSKTQKELHVVFGIGHPQLIQKLYTRFRNNPKLIFPNLIHPNCIGDFECIKLGEGNIICASNTLTTDINIGNFNIVNLDCTIGHDCSIGSFNVINPSVNISGGVQIGSHVLLGTNSSLLQYVKIHDEITVGAGAVVTKDLTEKGIYVGCPARKID